MSQSDGKEVICPKCKKKGVKRVFGDSFFVGGKSQSSVCSSGVCPICSGRD